jgi:hypothetical protein
MYELRVRHILTSYVSKACWKGNFYGDSDYTKFPTASGLNNTDPFDGQVGMVSCNGSIEHAQSYTNHIVPTEHLVRNRRLDL